jgi:ankyrin repeat protein
MDPRFHPAIAAIKSGDLEGLRLLLGKDPALAPARSSTSHPTLLQCLALDAVNVPNQIEMARLLIDAGAEINGPMVAAASINNFRVAALLLDRGAAINGVGSWSPLEEALYWGNQEVIDLLLKRGASVRNLRLASGLGRIDLIESFFRSDGSLKPEAGKIDWPFGELEKSNLNCQIKEELQTKVAQWSDDRQTIIDNAFVYACMNNQIDAAKLLLQKGAEIDAIPPGFDYSGTALHNAAVRGHRAMVDFLVEQGANVSVKDTKVHSTPAGWADYGGHQEIKITSSRWTRPNDRPFAGAGDARRRIRPTFRVALCVS